MRRQQHPVLMCMGRLCTCTPAVQARDNVKFLSTLERHFKAISSGPLPAIADCLLPLMSALRMVWIMSRHYGVLDSCGGTAGWRQLNPFSTHGSSTGLVVKSIRWS
jgi:hypothetical protein